MGKCSCLWPDACDGGGILECSRCGGEFCACGPCRGQGEIECPGCPNCEHVRVEEGFDQDPPIFGSDK